MKDYLIDLSASGLHEEKQLGRFQNIDQKLEADAAQHIESIKMWSKIADNFTQEDLRQVRRDHNEKLARYRKGKDWETWIEEDELDLEGERTLAEIKNYKSDYNFSSRSKF